MFKAALLTALIAQSSWMGEDLDRTRPSKSAQTASLAPLVLTCYIDATDSAMSNAAIQGAANFATDIWLKAAGIDWRFTQDEQYRPHAVVRLCATLPHYGMTIGRESVVRDGGYDGTPASVGLIVAHELGHVLGLRHVTEAGNLMGPYDGLSSARVSMLQRRDARMFDSAKFADVKPGAIAIALKQSPPPRHTILIFAYQDAPSMRVRASMAMSSPLQRVVDATSYHELADDDPRAAPYIDVVRRSRAKQSADRDAPAIILMDHDGSVLECVEGASLSAPEPLAKRLMAKARPSVNTP